MVYWDQLVFLILFYFVVLVVDVNGALFRTPFRHKKSSPKLLQPNIIVNNTKNNTAIEEIPQWKKDLPAPLNNKTKTLQRITIKGSGSSAVRIYLLGTAHVSKDSSRDVKLLLETIHPNVIFLELCDQRIPMLLPTAASTKDNHSQDQNNVTTAAATTKSTATKGKAPSIWAQFKQQRQQQKQQQGNNNNNNSGGAYGMASILLTQMQQDYADTLDVELGGEFRVAHDFWQQHQDSIHLILGDRPLYITLTRAWESLGLFGKIKLFVGLLFSALFHKTNPDELREWMEKILLDNDNDLLSQSINELRQHFPTLEEVIIKERDAYMACKLYQTCRELLLAASSSTSYITNSDEENEQVIVAIVGVGHVQGICNWLTVGNGQSPEQILSQLISIKSQQVPDPNLLINDVAEVNPALLRQIIEEHQEAEAAAAGASPSS